MFVLNPLQILPVHQNLGERFEQISGRQRSTPSRLGPMAVGRQLAQEQDGDRRQRGNFFDVELLELVVVVKPHVDFGRRFERRSVD